MARFASRARYEDLTAERRERLKVDVLDSLACAIGALGAPPIEAYLAQAQAFGGSGPRCTLIGGGQANVVYAAAYNTALIRYLDFMDSYLAGAELCHPSDNLGTVLAATEHAGGSGEDFLTNLAVAYQVEAALTAAASFMAHGFDLTTQLAYSLGAGLSKALRLDEKKAAWAVEICGATGIPLLVVRTTPISEWKGLVPSQLALGCVHGTLLASRGVSGPAYVIEGADGLAHALGRAVRVDWEAERLDFSTGSRSRATTAPSPRNRPSSACSSCGRPTRLIRTMSQASWARSSRTPTTSPAAENSDRRRMSTRRKMPTTACLTCFPSQPSMATSSQRSWIRRGSRCRTSKACSRMSRSGLTTASRPATPARCQAGSSSGSRVASRTAMR